MAKQNQQESNEKNQKNFISSKMIMIFVEMLLEKKVFCLYTFRGPWLHWNWNWKRMAKARLRNVCHDHNNHNIECYAVHIYILLRYLKNKVVILAD